MHPPHGLRARPAATCVVACALCVGAAPEPYLSATLASIADAVDVLVVNDNSGLARSENVATLEASPFGRGGRLHMAAHPFVDFATMRNDAHGMLRALDTTPDWVLFIDADEVHGEQIRSISREVLPRLPARVAELDAYTYHFWGTFKWITDVARRMAFYRYAPTLHWENAVHEKLRGLRGSTIVVPYVYHHYGNVLPPADLAAKHQRYFALGNAVPEPPQPSAASPAMYLARFRDVRPFRGAHPRAAEAARAAVQEASGPAFRALDEGFARLRGPVDRASTALQGVNETLRVRLRAVEHPGLYRGAMTAR